MSGHRHDRIGLSDSQSQERIQMEVLGLVRSGAVPGAV